MKKDDEDFPDWLKKMVDEGHTLYDNDEPVGSIVDDYFEMEDETIEELEDDEYYVTIVAELYNSSDDFIEEIEREDVGILCQEELDEITEKIKEENYLETVQHEVFDFLKFKVLDVYLLFEKRSHDHLIIYFQHKVEKI
jgi:hypothetical protein